MKVVCIERSDSARLACYMYHGHNFTACNVMLFLYNALVDCPLVAVVRSVYVASSTLLCKKFVGCVRFLPGVIL